MAKKVNSRKRHIVIDTLGLILAVFVHLPIAGSRRNDDVTGFSVLPRRWIIERTFAWLG